MILENIDYLVTQNEKREVKKEVDVLIRDGTIEEISDFIAGDQRIDCSGKIVTPGLINCHTHIPMNLFRGLSDNKKLDNWFLQDISPAEAKLEEDDIKLGSKHALLEMIKTGTTCFNDMYFYENIIADICQESGLRAVLSRVLTEEDGECLEKTKKLIYKVKDIEKIDVAVGPHSLYTCMEEKLRDSKQIHEENNIKIHTHLSETKNEYKKGKSQVERFHELGLINQDFIGAHAVYLNDKDIEILVKEGSSVVHNPCSNLKLGSGIANITKYREKGLKVGLGTDSVASNNNLNMFEEMKFACLLQKEKNPEKFTAQDAFDMATIEGAEILGKEKDIGSIEEGKKADLLFIDKEKVGLTPTYGKKGIVSNLVYSFNGMVDHTMVDGEFLMKNRCTEIFEESSVINEIEHRKNKFRNR